MDGNPTLREWIQENLPDDSEWVVIASAPLDEYEGDGYADIVPSSVAERSPEMLVDAADGIEDFYLTPKLDDIVASANYNEAYAEWRLVVVYE